MSGIFFLEIRHIFPVKEIEGVFHIQVFLQHPGLNIDPVHLITDNQRNAGADNLVPEPDRFVVDCRTSHT